MNYDELHPLMVHAPIALFVVALLFDVAAAVFRREDFQASALYVQVLGVLGAAASVLTGNAAEEEVERLPGIHDLIEIHERLGDIVLWAGLAVVALRLALRFRKVPLGMGLQSLMIALSLGLAVLVGFTGYYGGELVYEHGAGVAPVMKSLPPEREP